MTPGPAPTAITTGKFALYGGLQVKSWGENTVDYRHYRTRSLAGKPTGPTRSIPAASITCRCPPRWRLPRKIRQTSKIVG